jgi:hypothetical protein
MQSPHALKDPDRLVDLDAGGIEYLAFKFYGQSFAYQQLVDFGEPRTVAGDSPASDLLRPT